MREIGTDTGPTERYIYIYIYIYRDKEGDGERHTRAPSSAVSLMFHVPHHHPARVVGEILFARAQIDESAATVAVEEGAARL